MEKELAERPRLPDLNTLELHNLNQTLLTNTNSSAFKTRTTVISSVSVVLVLLALIGFLVWRQRRLKLHTQKNNLALTKIYDDLKNIGEPMPEDLKDSPLHDKLEYLPYKKQYEIANENLEKCIVLGKGNFGIVRKGFLKMAAPKTEEQEKKRLTFALKSAADQYGCSEGIR